MKILKRKTGVRAHECPGAGDEAEDLAVTNIRGNYSPGQYCFYGPESRTVLLCGEITPESSAALISQLLELDNDDDPEPIYLHINTPGGSAIDGFVIYDMIRSLTCPVVGFVVGSCMSAGLAVLAACDMRIATPNSTFFYHQVVMGGYEVSSKEHVDSLSTSYSEIQDKYDTMLRKRSKISKEDWDKHFAGRTSKFFSAVEAHRLGFVDELLSYQKKQIILGGE